MKKTLLIIFLFSIIICLYAGMGTPKLDYKGTPISNDELISLSRDTNFSVAIKTIELMAQKYGSKKIFNTSTFNEAIGTPINQLYWKDALDLIVLFNGLVIEELPGVYLIKDPLPEKKEEEKEKKISPNDKQIKISALFFKMDKGFLNNVGIDWSTLVDGEVVANVSQSASSGVQEEILNASVSSVLENGSMKLNLNALLKAIETNELGTVIARPNVTVISGKKGYIQVGEDFSVKTTEESGEVTETFYSTGVILDVKPTYINENGKEGIHLVAKVEKSSAAPGELSTIIQKSLSSTEVIMYNGEETVIAGLYDTEEAYTRGGIPILKDLPWWALGLKYLTGYSKKTTKVREMIVVIQAELMDDLDTRKAKPISAKEHIQRAREENANLKKHYNLDNEPTNKD